MRAVVVEQFGPLAAAKIAEIKPAKPGPDEVLVHGEAAGLNFPDILVIEGNYQVKPPLPFSPGKELAGVVAEVGANVTDFKPGDRVAAQIEYGAYAQAVVVHADSCFHIPDGMSFEEAAAMGLSYQTAYFALLARASFKAGERVLVNGAAGGVGLAALQLVKALGGVVLAAVINDDQAEVARRYGADHIIDTSREPLRDTLREQVKVATDGHGVDIVIDPVGGDVFEASLRAMAWCGRLVVIGFAAGGIPTVRAGYLLVKNISVLGLQWTDYRERTPERVREAQEHMYQLYTDGKLKPHVERVVPMEQFAEGLEAIRAGHIRGKAVLQLRD
ncbi:NADPH:quinone oxidoreductase family protein [Halomonas sp. HK25]|uniref:NADPH:quinone oxidoreductase family protein n=1 Tax=Halomonas sp. HK25 TaxID=3394321 RepID=UPI0039FBFE09